MDSQPLPLHGTRSEGIGKDPENWEAQSIRLLPSRPGRSRREDIGKQVGYFLSVFGLHGKAS